MPLTKSNAETIFLRSRAIRVSPCDLIGEGGEAEVYRLSSDTVLKLFKSPDHPSFGGDSSAARATRLAAEERIETHQSKLQHLPVFPQAVVRPLDLCTNRGGRIVGYSMNFIDNAFHLRNLCSRDFRSRAGINTSQVVQIFRTLHTALTQLHRDGIVIGDFNPLNVLVVKDEVRILDADSMQFNGYSCPTFSPRYTDPLLCDAARTEITPTSSHTIMSDWYAFAVMLFESLLFVHPYGGVYKGKNAPPLPPEARPLKRISVFHPDVTYPVAAAPLTDLPADVLNYFRSVLLNDHRSQFPSEMLDSLAGLKPVIQKAPVVIRRKPVSDCYVYHRNGAFYRENGRPILTGDLDHNLHFVPHGEQTVVTKCSDSYLIGPSGVERLPIEMYRDKEPAVCSNGTILYWIAGGELWCRVKDVTKHVDSVISKQTRIWAGPGFGVGLSHVGTLLRAFVFDSENPRIPIDLPPAQGYIVSSDCDFSGDQAYLTITFKRLGVEQSVRYTINDQGFVTSR